MPDSIRLLWYRTRKGVLPVGTAPPIVAIDQVSRSEDALASLERNPAHVAVVEVDAAPAWELIEAIGRNWADVGLVAVVASEDDTTRACRHGAAEVLLASASAEATLAAIERARNLARPAAERTPESSLASGASGGILGESPAVSQLRDIIAKVSGTTATVLVRGETGTGKELVARAIHQQSQVASGPLVPVHAAALPEDLLESELFGYEKGAFTGANVRKPGRLELAAGGTLFLDEIAELTPRMQTKLLRLVQEREFTRLGGTRPLRTDARFVAATHRDLEQQVARGEFREDLFYRLNVVTIWVPPLRARRDDIVLLAEHFLAGFAAANGRRLTFDAEALALLRSQRWPGNVRQLQNLTERLAVLATGERIDANAVKLELEGRGGFTTESQELVAEPGAAPSAGTLAPGSTLLPLKAQLERAERLALVKALERAKGNRTVAARLLGVGRRTLYTKLEEHGLL